MEQNYRYLELQRFGAMGSNRGTAKPNGRGKVSQVFSFTPEADLTTQCS
jgi:hypothetical protein